MAANGHQYIARPVLPALILLLLAAIIVKHYSGWVPFFLFITVFLILCFIFRDPRREVPSSPLAVVAPASGRLKELGKETDPWLKRPAMKYRIIMSLWDVHSLRSPTEGKVMNEWVTTDAEDGNRRQYACHIHTDEGDDVVLSVRPGKAALMAGIIARRGERVGQGQPLGFLFFTGVIEVYLPENSKTQIDPGVRIKSGSDILGQFVHGRGAAAA